LCYNRYMNKEIDISNVELKTSRLVLRPFRESDLEDLFEYAKVEGVGEMAGWPHHKSVEESKNILKMFIEDKNTFAIVKNNKVIGSIGIELYDEDELKEYNNLYGREIGYVLSKDYWGQGLMKEAVDEILKYLFNEVKLDFAVCGYFKFNSQSKRVQEKLGFKFHHEHTRKDAMGNVHDGVLNVMTREDYILMH